MIKLNMLFCGFAAYLGKLLLVPARQRQDCTVRK